MGQYWKLINIDRKEILEGIDGKWAAMFVTATQTDIHILASDNSWAGDRIILIGDSASYFPPGILTAKEGELDATDIQKFRVTSSCNMTVDWMPSSGEHTVVVRNFNAREYITDRLFPRKSAFLVSCHSSLSSFYADRVR
jgi:hypothetical protein